MLGLVLLSTGPGLHQKLPASQKLQMQKQLWLTTSSRLELRSYVTPVTGAKIRLNQSQAPASLASLHNIMHNPHISPRG